MDNEFVNTKLKTRDGDKLVKHMIDSYGHDLDNGDAGASNSTMAMHFINILSEINIINPKTHYTGVRDLLRVRVSQGTGAYENIETYAHDCAELGRLTSICASSYIYEDEDEWQGQGCWHAKKNYIRNIENN